MSDPSEITDLGEQTVMQKAFDELLHHLQAGQNTVETMKLGTQQIEALMGRLADLLTIARNSHTIALVDLPFLIPLFADADEWTLRRVFANSTPDTVAKFYRALASYRGKSPLK